MKSQHYFRLWLGAIWLQGIPWARYMVSLDHNELKVQGAKAQKGGACIVILFHKYRKVSNISRTKSQNLNDSRLILQLSLPNWLKPGVKSWMKM